MKITQASSNSLHIRTPQAADWALSNGISSFTTSEIAHVLGTSEDQVSPRLASAKRRGEWITPARGLWVPVPPEYRNWDGPPAVEFINELMLYLDVDYYLGWLSAAAMYGSAHHAPQVTQVATSRALRERDIGRVRLKFYTRSSINALPTVSRTVRYNTVKVSTPEITALDICSDIEIAGGINNVATIISELGEESVISPSSLLAFSKYYSPAVLRRLGWLMEQYSKVDGLDELAATASHSSKTPSLLDSLSPIRGSLNERWMLRINSKVEIEE